MSILAIVLIALVLVAAIALLIASRRRAQERELDDRRQVAARHRDEATARRVMANHEAARARAHEEHAAEIDPDAEARETPARAQSR
jgi:FtsZ-interacting cell division protein ZipA